VLETGGKLVAKVEAANPSARILYEYKVYRRLKGVDFVPTIKHLNKKIRDVCSGHGKYWDNLARVLQNAL
jgi:hypothetical protein